MNVEFHSGFKYLRGMLHKPIWVCSISLTTDIF